MAYHSVAGRKVTVRPTLEQSRYFIFQKPTIVTRGVFQGYSMPIYNNDNEELYYRTRVHFRWDGTTDINVSLYCYLASSEDVGDMFAFQLDYETLDGSNTVPDTSNNVYADATVVSGSSAQYSYYKLDFTIPAATVDSDDLLGARIRRITTSGNNCSGEIVAMYLVMEYNVNKCFGKW